MSKKRFPLRALISLLCGLYALALAVYLIARLVIGDSRWWLAFLNNFTPYYFAPLLILFPLALLTRAKRGVLLMLPLVLIGALWFAPLFLPKNVAQASGETLRVVQFNVLPGNQHLADVAQWLREENAAVILLEEVRWGDGDYLMQSLSDVYPYQTIQHTELPRLSMAAISRYPILEVEAPQATASSYHGYQRLIVNMDGQHIAFYVVHMATPFGSRQRFSLPVPIPFVNGVFTYDDTERNGQIRALIERLSAEQLPYIVGGDFNMSEFAAPYRDLAAVMTDSFREAESGLGASWAVADIAGLPHWLPPLLRIDYVWHSGAFHAIHVEQSPPLGSDHLGLSVTLQMQVE